MRPWQERDPGLFDADRSYWLGKGFEQVGGEDGGAVAFRGTVTVRRGGPEGLEHHPFELEVAYPSGYPFVAPSVRFLEPAIERQRHQGLDGAPCLFPPQKWSVSFPPSEFYAAIERWLGYHLAGSFPRELAIYELPEYFGWSGFSVITPPAAFQRFALKPSGGFGVQELLGCDLGVLSTVDGTNVGARFVEAIGWRSHKLKRHTGRWYRLGAEPAPMKYSHKLQALLREEGHSRALRKHPGKMELVGLVFPDTALGEERLLVLDMGSSSKQLSKAQLLRGFSLRAPQTYVLSDEELFKRLQGVRETSTLSEKSVAFFGLGAIGSSLALSLAREGLGCFLLFDPDTLRPGNVTRHALDLAVVGRFKAEAVDDEIGRINPFASTEHASENLNDPGVLAAGVERADLAVAAIGSDPLEEMISEVISRSERRPPLLLIRSLHAGAAYRVALMRTGVDACLTCLAGYRAEQSSNYIRVPKSDLPEIHDEGCAAPSLPGSGLTCQQAASFAAARALELLEGDSPEVNHWLWVERPIDCNDPRLQKALTLHTAKFAPREDCPVCGA